VPREPVTLRAEIRVNGTIADFGSLSARTVVTGADGTATLVYTAPPSSNGLSVDGFTVVDIAVVPVGSNFANSQIRVASVRLVPPGGVIPPDGLRPYFTVNPAAPQDHQSALFEACGDPARACAPPNNPIASYSWNFGDGHTASGRVTTHQYNSPGTYVVSLTVTDGFGRSATTSSSISVGAGVNPTASFVFSPTDPLPGTRVFFNATASRAAPGRSIVSYSWDFGDGTSGSGVQASHLYPALGSFTVTLVVTDDAGRTSSVSQTVPVAFPDEEEESIAPSKKRGGTLQH
jgi:chitodextrinase